MANADFSRQQNSTGGFDASSYRAAAPAEEEVRLTPFQQKLASLEKALPAALGKQAVAVALCIVVMLGCFVGFGGAKRSVLPLLRGSCPRQSRRGPDSYSGKNLRLPF